MIDLTLGEVGEVSGEVGEVSGEVGELTFGTLICRKKEDEKGIFLSGLSILGSWHHPPPINSDQSFILA